MKIKKFNEARSFNKEIRPIGDFLYDKFFIDCNFGRGGGIKEKLIEGGISRMYIIEILFENKDYPYRENDFQNFIEFAQYIKPYCLKNFRSSDGVNFEIGEKNFNPRNVNITIFLKPESVEEIKNLPEYQSWYDSVKDKYENYLLNRAVKKYNI